MIKIKCKDTSTVKMYATEYLGVECEAGKDEIVLKNVSDETVRRVRAFIKNNYLEAKGEDYGE